MLETICLPVVSYCEIPQEISMNSDFLESISCDVYVKYIVLDTVESVSTELDIWIMSTYPELIGKEFFIHIDY